MKKQKKTVNQSPDNIQLQENTSSQNTNNIKKELDIEPILTKANDNCITEQNVNYTLSTADEIQMSDTKISIDFPNIPALTDYCKYCEMALLYNNELIIKIKPFENIFNFLTNLLAYNKINIDVNLNMAYDTNKYTKGVYHIFNSKIKKINVTDIYKNGKYLTIFECIFNIEEYRISNK